MTLRQLEWAASERLKREWEQTAAIRFQVHQMCRSFGGEKVPSLTVDDFNHFKGASDAVRGSD